MRACSPTYQTAYAPIKIPVKNDPSVTPTLEILCTLDTCSLYSTNTDIDAIYVINGSLVLT